VAIDLGGHDVVSRLHLAMRPGAEAAGESRRALERLAGAIEDEQLETLRLLVTELVTNAVRHAGAPAGSTVELEVAASADRVRVEVVDHGRGFTPRPRSADQSKGSGWGLHLVQRLASRWGVDGQPRPRVWFELEPA